jgi:hypothetical protein
MTPHQRVVRPKLLAPDEVHDLVLLSPGTEAS